MLSKTQKNLERVARWFHALGDETRLQIIEILIEGEQCVCDLTDALQTGQSRLSFHLKTLKDAGLLKDRPEGRWVYYSVNPEMLAELQEFLAALQADSRESRRINRRCG